MRSKLQGLFERWQAQGHITLGAKVHPDAPHPGCRSGWELSSRGFSSVARPRDTSLWRGEVHPDAPHSGCRSRWELSSRGFSSVARPRYTPPWRGKVHRRPRSLSVTVRAKLLGLFERWQAQKRITPTGWIPPRCPSLWLSVTVRAKLQGLFWALPGPGTHHPGGVKVHPNNRKISYEWSSTIYGVIHPYPTPKSNIIKWQL